MYRKFHLTPGQKAPIGSTGKTLVDGSIVWIGDGSFPDDSIQSVEMTDLEIQNFIKMDFEAALDNHINQVAKAKGYDNRISCALRAGYDSPWKAEGDAFAKWMDACYTAAYQIMTDVADGKRQIPTINEMLAEMPVMVWP
jgi:hypothetical protein